MTVVSFTLTIEVDDAAWANVYGVGDGYDRAEAQRSRSLVADVEDYVTNQIAQSAAADEDAILSVAITSTRRIPLASQRRTIREDDPRGEADR